jgi:hypothetical protein
MRTTILCLVGALAAFGCARGQSTNMARAPHVDLPRTTAAAPAREAKSGPVYDTQQGFENNLPPPDAVGGGPVQGADSDVGEPKWRNNPGSYDDGRRPKHFNNIPQQDRNEKILPPDESLK